MHRFADIAYPEVYESSISVIHFRYTDWCVISDASMVVHGNRYNVGETAEIIL